MLKLIKTRTEATIIFKNNESIVIDASGMYMVVDVSKPNEEKEEIYIPLEGSTVNLKDSNMLIATKWILESITLSPYEVDQAEVLFRELLRQKDNFKQELQPELKND